MENDSFESEGGICARAAAAGYHLTHKMLKRYAGVELIGRSIQIHRTGKAGSETCYPIGTGDRAMAILRICGGKRRSVEFIAWNLWWHNIAVPARYVEGELRRTAEWYDRAISAIRKFFYPTRNGDMSEEGFTLIERTSNPGTRLREHFFRQIRKRILPDDRETAFALVIEFITGRFEPFIDSALDDDAARNRDILDKTLGLHRARQDRLTGAPPWLTTDVSQTLADVSHALRAVRFVDLEKSLNVDDRNRIRDELRDLIEIIANAAIPLEAVFGKYAFGFGVVVRLLKNRPPRIHAIGLLGWSVIRKLPAMREGIERLLCELSSSRNLLASFMRLREIRAADPRFMSVLTDRKMADALRDPAKMCALQNEILAIRLGAAG